MAALNLKPIATAIAGFAPTLAAMLGGPLAGAAVGALEGALGLQSGAGADGITEVTQAGLTPDTIAKVRQADQAHAEKMRELDISVESLNCAHEEAFAKVDADDRKSAREREVSVKDATPSLLAFGVTLGFFGTLGFMLVVGKPATGGDALLVMLGALGGAWASVISYYFGSSASSKGKDQLLYQSTPVKA
jgi:hypothetical protein